MTRKFVFLLLFAICAGAAVENQDLHLGVVAVFGFVLGAVIAFVCCVGEEA